MKRVIKTYENCGDEILQVLANKYPDGIKPKHISKIPTVKGDLMKVIELEFEDTIYLIKFNEGLEQAIDDIESQFGLTSDEDDDDLITDDENDIDIAIVDDKNLSKDINFLDSDIEDNEEL